MDNCEEASCDRGGSIGPEGSALMTGVFRHEVSSERSLPRFSGVIAFGETLVSPDVILAVGCGAQAQRRASGGCLGTERR